MIGIKLRDMTPRQRAAVKTHCGHARESFVQRRIRQHAGNGWQIRAQCRECGWIIPDTHIKRSLPIERYRDVDTAAYLTMIALRPPEPRAPKDKTQPTMHRSTYSAPTGKPPPGRSNWLGMPIQRTCPCNSANCPL